MIHLPTLNAILNATTTILLVLGYIFIRKKNMQAHRVCMVAAFGVSTVFLISYLTHHALNGSTKFLGSGLPRTIYFSILLTHTVLAAAIVPMVLVSLWKAWKGQFDRHRAWAKWTWPLWMYVSVTGVVIYWMLYQTKY